MKSVLDKLRNQKGFTPIKSGFTLIELLVVIAILGILAAVLLVGVNPLEQIRRGRDASRKNVVAQLGHAVESYVTGQATGGSATSYFADDTNWMATLTTQKEVKSIATLPEVPPTGAGGDCPAASMQTGTNVCYSSLDASTAVIWTFLESDQAATNCPAGSLAAAVWVSGQGKAGIGCMDNTTSVPGGAIVLY